MKKMYALLPLILFCASCASDAVRSSVASPKKNIRCMILIDEQAFNKQQKVGYTLTEEILASELPPNIEMTGREVTATSAAKLGIKIRESMNGIIDPVIKDYLIGTLKVDMIIVGTAEIKSSESGFETQMTLRLKAVRLSDDAILSVSKSEARIPAQTAVETDKAVARICVAQCLSGKGFRRSFSDEISSW